MRIFLLLLISLSTTYGQILRPDSKIAILSSEEEAAKQRFNLIDIGEREILISYFIYEDDRIGLSGLAHLYEKALQNPSTKIKLLFDASSNGVDRAILRVLEKQGIEVREYHPMPKLWVPDKEQSIKDFYTAIKRVNRRMHDKLLIVDGKHLITGGRNVENSYFALDEKNFHDRDIYVKSINAVQGARNYFLKLWSSDHVGKIVYRGDDLSKERLDLATKKLFKQIELINQSSDLGIDARKDLELVENHLHHKDIQFLSSHDPMNRVFDPNYLSRQLVEIAAKAKKKIVIETPYLIPTKRFFELADYLKEKEVELTIITNSYCSTDVTAIAAAYDAKKKKLLKHGVKIYEYAGDKYLHAKSGVIDDEIAIIGTYNMDPRSAFVNTEVAIVAKDKNVAHELSKQLQDDMDNSSLVQLKDRDYVGTKIVGANDDCDKSFKARFFYHASKPFFRVPFIYNLL